MIFWDFTSSGCLGPPYGWLSRAERGRLEELSVDKRRADWLLGRLSAKRLVRHIWAERHPPPPAAAIEIAARTSGAPFPRLAEEAAPLPGLAPGDPFPVALSISHSGGCAFSAAVYEPEPGSGVGADLERVEPRAHGFAADFFTADERALVHRSPERDVTVTAIWSAKESVLKALGVGLNADTRHVVCLPATPGWNGHLTCAWEPFTVSLEGGLAGQASTRVTGSWRRLRGFVLTIAEVEPAQERPEPGPPRHHERHPQPV